MRGQAGDCAYYYDRKGNEYRAIIQSESMNGNANLVFWEGEEPTESGLKVAMNTPHKSNTPNERNCYKHKPSGDWVDQLI